MKKLGTALALCVAFSASFTACQKEYYIPSPVSVPDTVSFAQHILPIFNDHCNMSGCHNTGGISPDLTEANAYFELTLTGMVKAEDPDNSPLYIRMNSNSKPMPPQGKLADGLVQTVRLWIEQGALEN